MPETKQVAPTSVKVAPESKEPAKKKTVKKPQSQSLVLLLQMRQQLLLTGLVVLVSLGILLAGVLPQVQGIFDKNTELVEEKAASSLLQKKIQALGQVETFDVVQQADQINAALPANKPLVELLAGISQLSTEIGVSVTDIKAQPGNISTQSAVTAGAAEGTARVSSKSNKNTTQKTKAFEELELAMIVEGSISSVNRFLAALEKTAPLTSVTRLSLAEQRRRDSQDQIFTAEVEVTSYYFTQTTKQAIAAPLPALSDSATIALEELQGFTFRNTQAPTQIQGGGTFNPFGL